MKLHQPSGRFIDSGIAPRDLFVISNSDLLRPACASGSGVYRNSNAWKVKNLVADVDGDGYEDLVRVYKSPVESDCNGRNYVTPLQILYGSPGGFLWNSLTAGSRIASYQELGISSFYGTRGLYRTFHK
jgi:hypothetical protein